jgi:hypothetical protein
VGGSFPTDFTDIHRFSSSEGFSSEFTDESEGILAYRITHGISQNFGRWPMARALYMLLLFFVTQISQKTQIFLRGGLFFPTDFTDIHRFWTCSVFGKKHADFADDAVFLFGYLGNFPFDYGKNESV